MRHGKREIIWRSRTHSKDPWNGRKRKISRKLMASVPHLPKGNGGEVALEESFSAPFRKIANDFFFYFLRGKGVGVDLKKKDVGLHKIFFFPSLTANSLKLVERKRDFRYLFISLFRGGCRRRERLQK